MLRNVLLGSVPNGNAFFCFFLFYSSFALSLTFPSVIDFTESLVVNWFCFQGVSSLPLPDPSKVLHKWSG